MRDARGVRAVVIAGLLVANAAHADVPAELADDRVELLDGRVAVRLVAGSELDDRGAHVDWGDARLTIVARDLGGVRAADVRERIAVELRGEGVAVAPLERLALARPVTGYGATVHVPRARDGRRLVYAAFATDRTGRLTELAFYVAGSDELDAWAKLGAQVASTISAREVHAHVLRRLQGECATLRDLTISPYPTDTIIVDRAFEGTLWNRPTSWSRWLDREGYHAEALAGDAHVVCTAPTRDALEVARRQVER
jgi:hypothetical protein